MTISQDIDTNGLAKEIYVDFQLQKNLLGLLNEK